MVQLLQMAPGADDADIEAYLQSRGLTEMQVRRLIQFVPIAFTRYLYRRSKIQFSTEFFVMGPQGSLVGGGRIVDEPAYQAAWDHCQQVLANNSGQHYVEIIAARSGGYKAIQNLLTQGAVLDELTMSPPILMG
jgi:hypothetical protein